MFYRVSGKLSLISISSPSLLVFIPAPFLPTLTSNDLNATSEEFDDELIVSSSETGTSRPSSTSDSKRF